MSNTDRDLIAELNALLTSQHYNPVAVWNYCAYARQFLDYLRQHDTPVTDVTEAQVGPCALSGHGFTVGVGGSKLFAQVLDAKFAPHPGEVVGDHRVVPVELTAAAAVFKILEPSGHSATARSGANGRARGDVAKHADGFIERRAVLTVEHGMDERGCHLWRNGGCRFGRCQSLGPRRHGLFDRLDRGQRRADQPGERIGHERRAA
ncbi:hypothetical protein KXX12_008047, partial [Aspergillus fumigatus]